VSNKIIVYFKNVGIVSLPHVIKNMNYFLILCWWNFYSNNFDNCWIL